MVEVARPLRSDARIFVAGAGSIGCFIGGLLALAGRRVTFLGRPRIIEEVRAHGLRLTNLAGLDVRLPAVRLDLTTDAAALHNADLVLVTVKSGATAAMAREIAAHCATGTTVLSLQNGVGNVEVLRSTLAGMDVLGGIVEFNVIHKAGGHFHRGTSGRVVIEVGREDLDALLAVPHLSIATAGDLTRLQWGKLLLNLNNALNALSGLPLRAQLQDREWRRLLADETEEALAVARAAGIDPAPLPAPPRLIPLILRLPNSLFRVLAAQLLAVDPEARSSMWEDLVRRRRTEIDYLQGEIVALGARHGIETPLCAAIVALVKRADDAAAGPPGLTPQDVRNAAMA
jgi:2-dehydropantoate 2-reductase